MWRTLPNWIFWIIQHWCYSIRQSSHEHGTWYSGYKCDFHTSLMLCVYISVVCTIAQLMLYHLNKLSPVFSIFISITMSIVLWVIIVCYSILYLNSYWISPETKLASSVTINWWKLKELNRCRPWSLSQAWTWPRNPGAFASIHGEAKHNIDTN